ncbi:hypothetical protein ACI3QN_13825, partial [Propionibacterium freudenreichii]|uniref:hypothetical protein n=1 Tax=Propionibacterium freudenreichii TaxID=1744 RepID=UPI003852DB32
QQHEAENADNPRMDIELVGAESLDAIRITHASYYTEGVSTAKEVESYLEKIMLEHGVAI